jgi:dTDP-4-amino-4,6-dideoxygalactose transaminase
MPKNIPHNRLTFGDAECDAVLRTVRSGQWAQGPRVEELESRLAQMAGVRHAVCVGSGLAALRLSLGALEIQPGDRVLVPAYSCVALANAALSWGAAPVAVDIEPGKWTIDSLEARRQSNDRCVKAGIAVNTFGFPAAMERLEGVSWIEDCAHAFGIEVDGKALGSRAEIGVLSFYATKLIGGGEGGAVLTNSSRIAEFISSSRDYGDQSADPHRLNDKMSDLDASLVLAQLDRLPDMIAARKKLAERYLERLTAAAGDGIFRLPSVGAQRIWYRFAVEMLTVPVEKVVNDLGPLGIHAAIPVTDWRPRGSPGTTIADHAYLSVVSLPLYPSLSTAEQDAVIEAFTKLSEGYARD